MDRTEITPGAVVGRWTVLDDFQVSPKGKRKWLCRCQCGTRRYVLERSLKYGGSESCGCLAREKSSQANGYDLMGQTFGDLKVVGRSRKRTQMGAYWTCLCSCGYTCEVAASELVAGKKTHCGCKTVKNYAFTDITGQQFGRLTALYPTEKRGHGGSVVWHCRCSCGKELEVSYNDLAYGNQLSCGCRKKEHDQKVHSFLTHVDGTCIDMLKSEKIPRNNTSGVKGVYWNRGRYVAKIVFQKKQYFLGSYASVEEAARARKLAEEALVGEVVCFYEKWSEKARRDPQWADQNPIKIHVNKADSRDLQVTLEPALE